MGIVIELPESLASALRADAEAHGKTVAETAVTRLAELYAPIDWEVVEALKESLAESAAGAPSVTLNELREILNLPARSQ